MNELAGAFAVVCAALCGFAFGYWLFTVVIKARKWDRFCATCGGEKSAMVVVEAAEATADAAADVMIRRGMRLVYRDGRPVNFPPSGDAA